MPVLKQRLRAGKSKAGAKTITAPKTVQAAPTSRYSVGQTVEACYGREWLRGRISKINQVHGANGPELAYDVRFDNGKRGVLPARMLREISGKSEEAESAAQEIKYI